MDCGRRSSRRQLWESEGRHRVIPTISSLRIGWSGFRMGMARKQEQHHVLRAWWRPYRERACRECAASRRGTEPPRLLTRSARQVIQDRALWSLIAAAVLRQIGQCALHGLHLDDLRAKFGSVRLRQFFYLRTRAVLVVPQA